MPEALPTGVHRPDPHGGRRMNRHTFRNVFLPLLIAVCLIFSHQTFGIVSVVTFFFGLFGLLGYPVAMLVLQFRAGRLAGFRGKFAVLAVSSWVSLLLVLSVLVGLRGEFHRPHSHRDENISFHPEMGHAPILRPGDAQRGVLLEDTIGQRREKVAGRREQVLLIGDSVVYGWRLEDDQTAAAILDELMPSLQVINGAVSGYSISQYYLYLKRNLARMKPRFVVVGIFAGNDYESTAMSNWSGHSTPLFVPDGDGLKLWREHTPRFNCVDFLSGSLLFRPLWSDLKFAERLGGMICNARTLEEPEHGEVVRRLLAEIDKLVRSHDAELVYLLLPDRWDFTSDTWYALEKTRYPHLARLLAEGEYEVHWFLDDIKGTGEPVESFYLPKDSAHLSAKGHRLLAEGLLRRIRGCQR